MQKVEHPVKKTFGLTDPEVSDKLTVPGFDQPGPFTPSADPDYQFRRELISDLLAWLVCGTREGLYLTGPTGAGKSSLVLQVAARLNYQVQRVTGHSRMELPELVGHYTAVGGDLLWQDGPLTLAMRYGHWFLLDELDLLEPGVLAGLNGIVEGAPLVLTENGGEVVKPHPDFRFIATGNTAGGGDATGLYQGTLRQNLAFMDRFWVVEVRYPLPREEEKILAQAVPQLPEPIRAKMVQMAGMVRDLFTGKDAEGPQLEVTLSTRTLVRWARLTWFFYGLNGKVNPIAHALDRALGFRAEPASRQVLHELVQREFGTGGAA